MPDTQPSQGRSPELAQEALEETIEEDAVLRAHLDEFDAHAFARGNVADDTVGADAAAWDFEDEAEGGAYDRGIDYGEERAAHAQGLRSGDLLVATTIPSHEQALRQRDALVAARGHSTKGFGSHNPEERYQPIR